MRSRAAPAATTALSILLLAAVPAVLIHLGALPMSGVPSTAALRAWVRQPLTGGFLAGLAQAGAWLIWALLAAAVLTRVYTRVTRTLRWLPTLHLPGPLRGLTAAVLGATAVTASTAGVPAHAGQPSAGATTTEQETTQSAPAEPTRPAHTAASHPDPTPAALRRDSYTVRRGDTLSEIADRCLGDPRRWPEIFALNRGTHFAAIGGTLRDPDLIYPGWTLDLPATAPPARQPRPPTPPPPAVDPPQADDSETETPSPAATTTASTTPRTPAPASPAESTSATDTASTNPDRSPTSGHGRQGVSLPSGSWVDIGLALAIAAAVALVWAHRRRRYVPRPPTAEPRGTDPDLAPMPLVVNQIRRGLRRAAAHHTRAIGHAGRDELDNNVNDETSSAPPEDAAQAGTPHTRDPELTDGRSRTGTDPLLAAQPHTLPEVWPPAGLGLTGPGAHAAARGFLAAALAAGGLEHPDGRTQVVMPSTTATTLLGAAAINLPRTPRLTVTADLDDALNILEAQVMHRARLVDRHDVDTVAGLRAADPYEEPVAPIMLLADPSTRHHRARIAALLVQGQRLDTHGVLLGEWPEGTTINVAEDGTTIAADGPEPVQFGRLSVINPTEAAGLLTTLAESHTGQLPAPARTETAPSREQVAPTHPPTPRDGGQQAETQGTAGAPAHPAHRRAQDPHIPDTAATSAATTALHTSAPQPSSAAEDATASTDTDGPCTADPAEAMPDPNSTDAQTLAPTRCRAEVAVLGAPRIINGDPQRKLRAKSLELLVYLAVRDGNASTEAILDDLLPDAPARKAVHRLHTYVSDLRGVLRHTGGPGTYLTHPHHRYQLNPEHFDIDLWRMRAAIRAADTATAKAERVAALRRAVETYRQPLAEGSEYEWLEPYREQVRQEALDAATALIEELTDQPAEQLAVLEAAISQHPYAEGLYQAAMRAQARLGDLDAVHALRRTLIRRLGEIDAEPADDTLALADQLIADMRRPGRNSRTPRPRDTDGALR